MADMDYVLHSSLSNITEQVATSFDWEFDIAWGENCAFYHPDISLIRKRVTEITGIENAQLPKAENMQIEMRGWTLLQPGLTETKPVTITIGFQDFDDQSIKAMLLDWGNKKDSMITHRSYKRSQVMVNMEIFRLNTARQRIWKVKCTNGILADVSYEDTYTKEKTPLGKGTFGIQFETAIPVPLNIS